MQNIYFMYQFEFYPIYYYPMKENSLTLPMLNNQKCQNFQFLNTEHQSYSPNYQINLSKERDQLMEGNGRNQILNENIENKRKNKKQRGVDKQKELESAKKNSESNIINQFFSFFSCRYQSEEMVQKAILTSVRKIEELQKIVLIFYNIMKCMSMQRIKKYVNKKTLLHIFGKENIEKEIPDILQKFQSLEFVTVDEICQVIRRCCFYFLRNTSLISILSSKRISYVSKNEHLKKRRLLSNIVAGRI